MTGIDLSQAAVDLAELGDWWAQLEDDRTHGTVRRWTEQQQDRDEHGQRIPLPATSTCDRCGAGLLHRDRRLNPEDPLDERTVLDGVPWCPNGCATSRTGLISRAPGRIDVIEVIADLGPALLELEDNVREVLHEPIEQIAGHRVYSRRRPVEQPARHHQGPGEGPVCLRCFHSSCAALRRVWAGGRALDALGEIGSTHDPRPAAAARWLSIHVHRITDAGLREHVDRESARMARAARRTLGTSERVQRLDRPCPVCGRLSLAGFLERCPRNRWQRCSDLKCVADHGQVVCTANEPGEPPLCECSLERCSCHRGGRHRWDPEDFRRLGLVIEAS